MPRYLVERTFPGGLAISADRAGAAAFDRVVAHNADVGVTWLHSYLSEDKQTMVCVYDGPGPEAIRKAAELSDLPIDRITRVWVLDPHPYR
jgi:Nickel responsive protein SCO4226-like